MVESMCLGTRSSHAWDSQCLGGNGALIDLGDSAAEDTGVAGYRKAGTDVDGTGDSGIGSM